MLDYAAGPTQCGTVWLTLVPGRGESISSVLDKGSATTPQRWSMWVPQILVTQTSLVNWLCSGWCLLLSRPEQAVVCWLCRGHSNMTGHEEPPAHLSRGVMPLS